MKKQLYILRPILISFLATLVYSCQPENRSASIGINIEFSKDTLYLDTVFSSIGSSTRSFTIKNTSGQNILLDRINLGKGQESPFRFNVNGISGPDVKNLLLPAYDSIWVFVELTAPLGSLEMLWTDSIIFSNKGLSQDIKLVSLALDAHFYFPNKTLVIPKDPPHSDIIIPYSILPANSIWSNDKPHVVYGYAVIDSGGTLDINSRSKVHFHSGSGLWVSSGGTLNIDASKAGSYSDPVILEGDRLEPFYSNIAGQWGGTLGGIFIQRGAKANIHGAWIKNGTTGIRCDSVSETEQRNLLISNSRITDFSRVSIYSGFGNIEMHNVIIANSGLYGLYCLGGRVFIDHCTFSNDFPTARSTPTIGLFNRYEDANGTYRYRALREAYFGNCIVAGSKESEIGFDFGVDADFNYKFQGSLLKINLNPSFANYDIYNSNNFFKCLFNGDPSFELPLSHNYELDSNSNAINIGLAESAMRVPFDAKNISRLSEPDAGALEKN